MTGWKEGQPLSESGRALGKHAGSIYGVLFLHGGIFPVKQKRSRLALTLLEREDISRGIAAGYSIRWIASKIGRFPSTVSREIHRHGGIKKYRAAEADWAAWDSARRPKLCRLATNAKLHGIVANKKRPAVRFPPCRTFLVYGEEAVYRRLFKFNKRYINRGVARTGPWLVAIPSESMSSRR